MTIRKKLSAVLGRFIRNTPPDSHATNPMTLIGPLVDGLRVPVSQLSDIAELLARSDDKGIRNNAINELQSTIASIVVALDSLSNLVEIGAASPISTIEEFSAQELLDHIERMCRGPAELNGMHYYSSVDEHTPSNVLGNKIITYKCIEQISVMLLRLRSRGSFTIQVRYEEESSRRFALVFDIEATGEPAVVPDISIESGIEFSRELLTTISGHLKDADTSAVSSVRYVLTVPVSEVTRSRIAEQSDQLDGRGVLVLSDGEIADRLKRFLGDWGIHFEFANTTPALVAKLIDHANNNARFDLVIVDGKLLSGINPADLLRMVAAEYSLGRLRYIYLSPGRPSPVEVGRLNAIGYSAVISHDFSKPVLFHTLHRTLQRRESLYLADNVSELYRSASKRFIRIVLIEPNPIAAHVMHATFHGEGMNVKVFYDGSTALTEIGESEYDAVIFNTNLPDCDGQSFLRRLLAQDEKGRAPATIAISSSSDTKLLETYKRLGASRVIVKPVTQRTLLSTVGDILLERARHIPDEPNRFRYFNPSLLSETVETMGSKALAEQHLLKLYKSALTVVETFPPQLAAKDQLGIQNSMKLLRSYGNELYAPAVIESLNDIEHSISSDLSSIPPKLNQLKQVLDAYISEARDYFSG